MHHAKDLLPAAAVALDQVIHGGARIGRRNGVQLEGPEDDLDLRWVPGERAVEIREAYVTPRAHEIPPELHPHGYIQHPTDRRRVVFAGIPQALPRE